jgi:hypothetical protein
MLLEALPTFVPHQFQCLSPFRFERRETPRWKLEGSASVIALGAELGETFELTTLEGAPWWLQGMCQGGMCQGSAKAPPIGIEVSVGFSNPEFRHARAIVERIETCEQGTRVALRFIDAPVA